jgi:CxxC motif-containing protein
VNDGVSTYLCTGCPLGCRLEVEVVEDDVVEVRGFACRRGERYGRQEHLDPRRSVTTTVWIEGAVIRRAPVRTAEEVPKDRIDDVVRALRGLQVRAPIRRGDLVLADAGGTGIDVVATRDLARLERHLPSSEHRRFHETGERRQATD